MTLPGVWKLKKLTSSGEIVNSKNWREFSQKMTARKEGGVITQEEYYVNQKVQEME